MAKEPAHPILVVDDDPGQRSLLCSFLTGQGFPVTTASSGQEALELLAAAQPGMLISDVRMPGMTGLELLGFVAERHPDLPVLLVTAYADIRDAVGAIRGGAVDYLEKPIDLDQLLEAGAFISAHAEAARLSGRFGEWYKEFKEQVIFRDYLGRFPFCRHYYASLRFCRERSFLETVTGVRRLAKALA